MLKRDDIVGHQQSGQDAGGLRKRLQGGTKCHVILERNRCRAPRTPDWFERVSPMKPQQAQHFDVAKATTASPSDGRSSSVKSPGESTIAQRTPDPFEERRRRFGLASQSLEFQIFRHHLLLTGRKIGLACHKSMASLDAQKS